ncbi:MAG: DNA polymerase III subunit delta', partial [Actinobacteria bacterium]|nr:DNA polymerase III subunit delta' [Actinomycetota bacterium]
MSVFDIVVGQEHAVAELKQISQAATQANPLETKAMTHAWLITGPPGSGRSTLAMAFAQALVCPKG